MVAMNATPASTATGRSQLAPVSHEGGRLAPVPAVSPWAATVRPASCGSRNRGTERERGHDSEPGQAQCPRQTQVRARMAAPLITLSSHG